MLGYCVDAVPALLRPTAGERKSGRRSVRSVRSGLAVTVRDSQRTGRCRRLRYGSGLLADVGYDKFREAGQLGDFRIRRAVATKDKQHGNVGAGAGAAISPLTQRLSPTTADGSLVTAAPVSLVAAIYRSVTLPAAGC